MENSRRIISGKTFVTNCNPGGIGCALYESMIKNKNDVAQICASTGTTETFAELFQRSVRTAIHMKKRGIKEGDIVALCSYNHMNSGVPFIAATFLGCIPASFDPSVSMEDNKHLLKQINPKIVFVVEECVEMMEQAVSSLNYDVEFVVYSNETKHTSFGEFLVELSEDEEINFQPVACRNITDTGIIIFSSGTTGLPKGICLSHYSLLAQCLRSSVRWTVAANFTTLYWMSGIITFIGSLISGSAKVICKAFDPVRVWDWIRDHKIQIMIMAPHLLMEAIYKKPADADTSSLMICVVGGAPVSSHQLQEARKTFKGVIVGVGYGQTENGGGTIANKMESAEDLKNLYSKGATLGKVLDGITVKVVDPETDAVLGPNQPGELRIKSHFLMNGYHNLDSSECYDKDGWFKSGDIMYYDEEEYFYYVDRQRDILKYRQYHVIPSILEDILKTHPAVLHAAVIGIPDEIDGDHPMAFVSLKDGYGSVSAEELKEYHDEKVDDHKKLRGGLKIIEKFPMSPTDKIKKRTLKEMALKNLI